MAKGMRIGVNNVARKIIGGFIGVNNIARKLTKGYIGVNNLATQFFESNEPIPDQEIVFTSSQSWTVPAECKTIDIFVVGGGGGAGGCYHNCNNLLQNNATYKDCELYGSSGGSGYTNTVTGVSVTPGETLSIVVGAGGTGGKGCEISGSTQTGDVSSNAAITSGTAGGQSYISRGSTKLATANGGNGGTRVAQSNSAFYTNGVKGVNGGNGSGAGGSKYEQITIDSQGSGTSLDVAYVAHQDGSPSYPGNVYHGIHGTDGGNGGGIDYWTYSSDVWRRQSSNIYLGGTGQGHNTKKYGNASDTAYATVATRSSANTGNSGDGNLLGSYTIRNGSSGVVIIMCHFQ